MLNKKLYIYTDGGSRGNPGPSAIGVVIKDSEKKKIAEINEFIGSATNNVAEYSALIRGLEEAVNLNATDVMVYMDSELLVRQLSGEYRVKDENMKLLFSRAIKIANSFKSFEIKHIERAKNKEADRLVNKALNLASF